ncbi:MAG: hypothetical protein EOO38_06375 [Cytophagaceae bacterium]|jgi:hypothetical protein|nr:MAG: hypothetical protein EOO38_06375 [Cytophagaceae bacterium]
MNQNGRLINVRNELEHVMQLILLLQRFNEEVELLPNISDKLVNDLEDTLGDLQDCLRLAYDNLELAMRSKPASPTERT